MAAAEVASGWLARGCVYRGLWGSNTIRRRVPVASAKRSTIRGSRGTCRARAKPVARLAVCQIVQGAERTLRAAPIFRDGVRSVLWAPLGTPARARRMAVGPPGATLT